MADDLGRFLEDRPVLAQRPTRRQRAAKWIKRHRAVAWMGFVLLLVLAVGSGVSTGLIAWQLARADAERDRALNAEAEATRNLDKVQVAEREKTERLGQARLAEARADRWSGRAGRAFDGLRALAEAAQIARTLGLPEERFLELRNEAIACLALPDLERRPEYDRYTTEGAVDPNLRQHALSDDRGTITIRRIPDDREIARLEGLGSPPSVLEFSPDGRYLAAVVIREFEGKPVQVAVWNVGRGEIVLRVPVGAPKPFLAWSPDSRVLATVHDHWEQGPVTVYDLEAHKEVRHFPADIPVDSVAFHPNGKQMALMAIGAVQIRDLATGNVVSRFAFPVPTRHVAWGCDGRLLTGAYAESTQPGPVTDDRNRHVYVWDIKAGRLLHGWKGT